MLSKRIIPCLDVRDGVVVKGVQFGQHKVLGDILELAERYRAGGADELVFYDITASVEDRVVSVDWVARVAECLDIPFCVAGGIRSVAAAERVLNAGAEHISVNSPALERPELISELSRAFGSQAVVVGIDSRQVAEDYVTYQYTGSSEHSRPAGRPTTEWAREAAERGAGEIVLNCMNQDGVGRGYDIAQLSRVRAAITIPLVASGGAGTMAHFVEVFERAGVDGALAAGVFHRGEIDIADLKAELRKRKIRVRT